MSQAATIPASGPVAVIPRNLRFVRDQIDAKNWAGNPVATAVFNALSLTFPDGERMFMDSVRHFKHLTDGKLLEEANAFITQEAIHTREHVMLNKSLEGKHYPTEEIRKIIRARQKIAEDRGPMAMLIATICLEHFTAMLGNDILTHPEMVKEYPEEVARLWLWHALEETEHKAVAYDVYQVATKDWTGWQRYIRRCMALIIITLNFAGNINTFAAMLLQADGMGKWEARARVFWHLWGKPGFFRKGWVGYFDWFKPNFHPWQHDNSALLESWRQKFAAEQPQAAAAQAA